MLSLAQVRIHPSQFPEQVRRDLLESLRSRQVNHKFHYDSLKQTQQWLALHQVYSPSRTDPDCAQTYDRSFAAVAAGLTGKRVHVIGLGCGGGQKDSRLLKLLRNSGKDVSYIPADVSLAMVLVARQAAGEAIPLERCFPLVCDLATAEDLPAVLDETVGPEATRLLTCFGMLPNFDPGVFLPRLGDLLRPQDKLLVSANLAPGPDFAAGVSRVLPLYDNPLTREWLLTFLLDLGTEKSDGRIQFRVEDEPRWGGLKRIAAYFEWDHPRRLRLDLESFSFEPGDSIRLFFSYRHTPALLQELLDRTGLCTTRQWVTASAEEGVFLVARR